MIVRNEGGRVLVDLEALSVMLGRRSPATIRKHCTACATDIDTGRQLFDRAEAVETMAKVPQRTTTRRQAKLTNDRL